MAVIARNKRSQEEIYNSLGLKYPGTSSSGPSRRNQMIDPTPGYVAARNPVPSASQIQGMPKNPISFSAPPATANGSNGVTVGARPAGGSGAGTGSNASASYNSGFQRRQAPRYEAFDYDDWDRPDFRTSDLTKGYLQKMQETEAARPEAFESRYEGAIQNILDGILNGNPQRFDINKDANYQALYDLYSQQYQANANRALRDNMGAMQAATGGYGSTAATAAAGQAYDRAIEGLNDRNMQLMQMAYQMYGDAQADRYNQLGAVTGLDNSDYARYRDTVGDWQTDRNYFADQYQRMYGNDWQKYAFDTQLDWDKYQFQTGLDFQNHQNAQNRLWDDYTFGTQMDWSQYTDSADREYQRGRDELSDYDSAFDKAYKLAAAGQSIPAAYANKLEPETVASLQALAQQALADKAAKGSGGRSGRGGGRRSAANKSVEVMTGQPYASGLGYTANRNMVIDAIKKQGDNQGKYNVIEDAVADGMITQEQGLELLRDAKVDLLKTTSAPDYIRRHYVDAGTKVKKKK